MFKFSLAVLLAVCALCQASPLKKRNLKNDLDQWAANNPDEAKALEALITEMLGMSMEEIGAMVKDLSQDEMDAFVKEAEKWMKEFEAEMAALQAEVEKIIGQSVDDLDMEEISLDDLKSIFEEGDGDMKKRGMKKDVDDWAAQNPGQAQALEKTIEEWTSMTMEDIGAMVKDFNQGEFDSFVQEAEKWMEDNAEEAAKMQAEVEEIIGHPIDSFDMDDISLDDLKALFEEDSSSASGGASVKAKRAMSGSADADFGMGTTGSDGSDGSFGSGVTDGSVGSGVTDGSDGSFGSGVTDGSAGSDGSDGGDSQAGSFEMSTDAFDMPSAMKKFDFKPIEFKPFKFDKNGLTKSLKRAFMKRSLQKLFKKTL